jgi:hypothetical protein
LRCSLTARGELGKAPSKYRLNNHIQKREAINSVKPPSNVLEQGGWNEPMNYEVGVQLGSLGVLSRLSGCGDPIAFDDFTAARHWRFAYGKNQRTSHSSMQEENTEKFFD